MTSARLLLASASPRRAELLRQIGVSFEVVAQDIDETPGKAEQAVDYVQRMAAEKAGAALASLALEEEAGGVQQHKTVVLASDTTVVCAGQVLGKPADEDEAVAMLLALAGREHEVMTAVCVGTAGRRESRLSISRVTFREIAEDEARTYWHTGEPSGKAGAYAIQGMGAIFVASITGSYSGVMGLPLFETANLLAAFGIPVWSMSAFGESS